jgi:hypothetical protein
VGDGDFPIVLYVDDTLLIMEADSAQISTLKQDLHDFSTSTGLSVKTTRKTAIGSTATRSALNMWFTASIYP